MLMIGVTGYEFARRCDVKYIATKFSHMIEIDLWITQASAGAMRCGFFSGLLYKQ